ncbi:MAG: glucose PTS transporter subunit IIA [Clostridium sp.]|jgi:PTS system D-glucosamine-specific IIC component|nr:glucose PTS transporter subunit IIA [Clostridium sp.]
MKDKIFGVLQRVGRSFMLPIAILPVAGLFLGIGGSFTNANMIEAYGLTKILGEGTLLHALLVVLNKCGDIVFANLPLIFAMGVAIGMAKKEKDVAALSGAIAFLIMHSAIGALLDLTGKATTLPDGSVTSVLGIQSLQMGVFGGILVGLGVAALHNRFYKIELPQVLSFFGGTRFVPIISAIVYLFVGILMFFIWPVIQNGIFAIGDLVRSSGYAGTFLYGLMERALIPFGLHHVFYLPFWQTAVGGTAMVGGQLVEGAQNIFFAELANGNISHFSVEATRFMSGKFPLMIFGLPGAALAMYKCANPKKKKIVSSLLLSAALTSMITGITEPIEFTFLFVAPVLYAVHCVFAGLAYMFMHIFNVGVGMTFSGGLIDLTLFGIMQGNAKTNWIWVVIVGIVYFIVYYFLFSFLIKKFNFKTPGRDENEEEVKLYTRNDVNAKNSKENNEENGANIEDKISAMICKGLGGKKNISDVDCCATRLRCTVYKSDLVDDDLLKSTGASGVIRKGEGVQIIYGPKVTVIKSNLEDYLVTAPNIEETKNTPISNTEVKEKDNKKETKENSNFKEIAKFSSPVKGIAAPIEETPDEAFAGKMMGDGIMIMPEDSTVFAPCDGEVLFVFPSKHAVGIKTTDGFEILIHIGINTVELNGEGFEAFVASGDKVKKGDKLISFDIEYIKDKVPSMATPFIFTALNENQRVKLIKKGEVNALEDVLIIEENI